MSSMPSQIVLCVVLLGACGPGADSSLNGTLESFDTGEPGETGGHGTSPSDGGTGMGIGASSGSMSYDQLPPNCTDNGPSLYRRVLDDNRIRFSSLEFDCAAPEGIPPKHDCSYDDYDAVLTVEGLEPGTYALDGSTTAALTIERTWDHEQTVEGCFCVDSPTSIGESVVTGSVRIELFDGEGYAFIVKFEGVEWPVGDLLVEHACGHGE